MGVSAVLLGDLSLQGGQATLFILVARKRFELLSRAPEAPMLDHYTTGLRNTEQSCRVINFNVAMPFAVFCFQCFADAVAFLADTVIAAHSAQSVSTMGSRLWPVPCGAEHFIGVLVAVVAVAVAAVFAVLAILGSLRVSFHGS